jgi:hypothetical protein
MAIASGSQPSTASRESVSAHSPTKIAVRESLTSPRIALRKIWTKRIGVV